MMMDPAVKTGMAVCVLLAGICAASLFRRDAPRHKSGDKPAAGELRIRSRLNAPASAAKTAKATPAVNFSTDYGKTPEKTGSDDPLFADRPATIVTPLAHRESPPPMSSNYPENKTATSSRWGASMEMMLPVVKTADETPQTHRIVDGDTLAALAERYLGDASRAGEIFEANRGVIASPELLTIGVELKIPPKRARP